MVTTEHSPEGLYDDPHLHVWLGGNFWYGRVPDLTEQGLPPPIYPNEMANALSSRFGGYSPLLVQKHREPAVAGFC
jgi:cytochrome c peroxidase